MAVVGVRHSKVVTIPDDPNYPVGSDEWNENHVVTGLENVDNTADANKPVSTAQAAAISAAVAGVTKTSIGLGSVDNTSDASKPVSTAQAAAIALKADISSPTLTGTPAAPTATLGTNTTQLATTAFVLANAGTGAVRYDTAQTITAAQKDQARANIGIIGRNRLINGGFIVNQRIYTSGTAKTVGLYMHDRWKAGASGCTYTFTQSGNPLTTITITAGSLQQVVEGVNIEGGSYTLSWTGTAQGKVNGGTAAASPITVTGLTAGSNVTIEFLTGTVGAAQFEAGTVASAFEVLAFGTVLSLSKRYYEKSYDSTVAPGTSGANGICDMQVPTSGTGQMFIQVFFKTDKMTTPTVNLYDNLGAVGKVFKGGSGKTGVTQSISLAGFSAGTSDVTSAFEVAFHYTAESEL